MPTQSTTNFGNDELQCRKWDILTKLTKLAQTGIKLSQEYTIDSDYHSMQQEYEVHRNIIERKNGTAHIKKILIICITCVEILNEKYNPFDLNLKGLSEQISANIDNYDDIFSKLYDTIKKMEQVELPPQLRLLFILITNVLTTHIKNSIFNSP